MFANAHTKHACMQPKQEQQAQEVVNPIKMAKAGAIEILTVKLDARNNKCAKDRKNHLRKEQLSQGVLKRIIQSLGRLTFEEVQCAFVLINCTRSVTKTDDLCL